MATSVSKTYTYDNIPYTATISSSISGKTVTVTYSIKAGSNWMKAKAWWGSGSDWIQKSVPWSGTKTYTRKFDISGPTDFTVAESIVHPDYGTNHTIISNTTLSQTPASYTISYNANGGSGAPSSQTKYWGTDITLSSSAPSRTGYTFSGWNTQSNGSGTSYSKGSNYSSNSSVTLYAKWTPNTYSVTFDANGGTNAPSSQTKTYGQNLTLTSSIPKKERYNFKGWAETSTATSAAYQPGGTFSKVITSNITLYAVWELAYIPPVVKTLSVIRCDVDGNDQDDGTFMKVIATCEVDKVFQADNHPHMRGTYKSKNTPDQEFDMDILEDGSFLEIVSGVDTDTQYTVTVIAYDDVTIDGKTYVGTKSAILTRSHFVMDFKAGGEGIGIGSAAPESGLLVGMPATFLNDVSQMTYLSSDITPSSNSYERGFYIKEDDDNDWAYLRAVKFTGGNQGLQLEARRVVNGSPVYNNVTLTIHNDGSREIGFSSPIDWRKSLKVSSSCLRITSLSSNMSLTTSATKIPLITSSKNDPDNLLEVYNNGVKCNANGTIAIIASAYLHSGFTVNDIVHVMIYKNTSCWTDHGLRVRLEAPYQDVEACQMMGVSAGDVIYLYAYNQTGARGLIGSTSNRTYINVCYVAR